MFFKRSAQKNKTADTFGKEVFIGYLADEYLQFSFKNLDEEVVKNALRGKFASLKYTLTGFDPSELSYEEKITLINVLYDLNLEKVGAISAKENIEKIGLRIKQRYGLDKSFIEGIKDLPDRVFLVHRVDYLSEDDLREKLKASIFELEKATSLADKGKMEEAMELSAENDILEAVLYNASDGVFALDRQGRIITFNKVMEDLTGYKYSEAHLKSADQVVRFFQESNPIETGLYCSMPGGKAESFSYINEKTTLVTRNGSKKYVNMISSGVQEGRNVNVGCVVTLKDITKDIELESMKLDFVSMAAHELRTPLTAMRGYLSLLNDELKEDLEEKFATYLEKTTIATDQLHVLVENLLNITRIERGTLVLDKTRQKWVPLVKEVVTQFEDFATNGGLTLSFVDTKGKIPEVFVDKVMITEVLTNLLDNAIRYTPAGGRITVFVEELDGKIITHIKDTGVGIPQASIPHLFKKFYRVTTALKAGKKGTGLGLFISKEIVKLHGGDIWVESKENEGSVFSFSIPIEKKEIESKK